MPKDKPRMKKGGRTHKVGQAGRLAREGYPKDKEKTAHTGTRDRALRAGQSLISRSEHIESMSKFLRDLHATRK